MALQASSGIFAHDVPIPQRVWLVSLIASRWKRFLLVAFLAVAALLLQLRTNDDQHVVVPVQDSESATADSVLRTSFPSPAADIAILVIEGLPLRADSDSGRALVRRLIAPLGSMSGAGSIVSPGTSLDTLLVGSSGHVVLGLVALPSISTRLLQQLRNATQTIEQRERARIPSLQLRWTGQPFIVADLKSAGEAASRTAELIALPLAFMAAWWAFGSAVAAAVALLIAGMVAVIALGVTGILHVVIMPSPMTRSIVSLVAIALTIDYLLLITRGKQLSNVDRTRENALLLNTTTPSVHNAHRTAILAALVVACGFLSLTFAPTRELRGTGVAGAFTAVLSAAVAIFLSPLVAESRRRINGVSERWNGWGAFVAQHRFVVAALSAVPLVALALHARTIRLNTPLHNWLPADTESARALDVMTHEQRGNLAGTSRVLIHLPEGVTVFDERGWTTLDTMRKEILQVDPSASVRSIATIGTRERVVAQAVFSPALRGHFVSRNERWALLEVIPGAQDMASASSIMHAIRALDPVRSTGLASTDIQVTGLPAYTADYESAARDSLGRVITAASIASLLAMLLVLRAPLMAIKALVLNLLVVAASMGATVFVFQDGIGVQLMGFAVSGSVMPTVPLLVFAATFGMSMDYELFLLNFVMARRGQNENEAESIARGVGDAGPLIVRAAAVMIAVFVAFAMSNVLPLAIIGFALTVAIVLDATAVRMALAPALLAIGGRYNWWPRHGVNGGRGVA